MLGRRSDLPFRRDATSRYLPWIIAVMVYLAALALAGAMVLGSAVSGWSRGLTGTLTVQIPAADAGEAAVEARVRTAVRLLRETPGIARVEVLDRRQLNALLEPWLGPDVALARLPLPRLIDVTLAADADVDAAAVALRLSEKVPEATVDDHRKWLGELMRLVRSMEIVSGLVVLLVGLAAVATVVFAARTGLAIHMGVIEVMHLIGAQDRFIAKQFQLQALALGLRGGLVGLALAAATVAVVGRVAADVSFFALSGVGLSPLQWAVLAALPAAAALITMVTARLTVLRTLARML